MFFIAFCKQSGREKSGKVFKKSFRQLLFLRNHLSGHCSIPRGCPLNTGLILTVERAFIMHWRKRYSWFSYQKVARVALFFNSSSFRHTIESKKPLRAFLIEVIMTKIIGAFVGQNQEEEEVSQSTASTVLLNWSCFTDYAISTIFSVVWCSWTLIRSRY